ncbi:MULTISPECIES: hypothetical protein [Xanthomonas]|uniref:TonB C-terminal domain-containing protein n=2 Tax=Xanthomonas TaxID=338 RepID=A0A2P5Z7V1_9XANT|nr:MULTISPECIES: hypothetical protein [Xanthomonas]MBO9827051.1 hypothetical protein [Xanthomonas sp. A2111]MBO9874155.1 hypothetical protein [Xanthomonas sp. D-93]MDS9994860.1 hypothetical protein [Xanthomonas sp. A2111]MDV0437564.1 hypothetical protein [Xanthomonas sacchari]PPU84435.1 hypothetical protein XsacCFBP4641_05060 [Xanthomonas sacchari]
MLRTLPCLFAAALAVPALAAPAADTPAPSDYAAAKALADRDEASLPAAMEERLQTLQRAALDEGVASCATPRPDTSPFTVVVQVQADGSVGASWRNGTTPLALCLERFLRQRPLLAPPQAPLYLSYEVSFEK